MHERSSWSCTKREGRKLGFARVNLTQPRCFSISRVSGIPAGPTAPLAATPAGGRGRWPWRTQHLSCMSRGESGAKDHRACCCTVVCLCNLFARTGCPSFLVCSFAGAFVSILSPSVRRRRMSEAPRSQFPLHATARGATPRVPQRGSCPCPSACLLCFTHRTCTSVFTNLVGREGFNIKRRNTHDPALPGPNRTRLQCPSGGH